MGSQKILQKDKKISVALKTAILDTIHLMDLQDQTIHHLPHKLPPLTAKSKIKEKSRIKFRLLEYLLYIILVNLKIS